MDKYECKNCCYVYDEAKGESGMFIKRGTRFEDLPDIIVCCVCGAPKSNFVKVEKPASQKQA